MHKNISTVFCSSGGVMNNNELHYGLHCNVLWTTLRCTMDYTTMYYRLHYDVLWTTLHCSVMQCSTVYCRQQSTAIQTTVQCNMDYTALHCRLHFSTVHFTLFVKESSVVWGVIEMDAGSYVEAPQPGSTSSTPLTSYHLGKD